MLGKGQWAGYTIVGFPLCLDLDFEAKHFPLTETWRALVNFPCNPPSRIWSVSRDKAEIVNHFEPDAIVSCPYKDLLNIGKFVQ